jgi:phenylpropionate dioxygenase-like ring-hydroxylating dioxygenase large terminal subunit
MSDSQTEQWVRWDTKFPWLGKAPVSIQPYVSPEYYEKERRAVFGRMWLQVCRVDDVPNPGDYFVRELAVLNTSVLVVRGTDGVVRGFHNVCQHKANRVALSERGSCRALNCRFHGWTYGLDGRLVSVPDEQGFCEPVKKGERGLKPVATDTWEGFVFVNLDPKPHETLKEFLGEFAQSLEGYPFSKMTMYFKHRAEVHCNWKILVDAFQDGYHLRSQHRYSLAEMFMGDPSKTFADIKFFKRHRFLSSNGNPKFTPFPTMMLAFTHGGYFSPEIFPPGWMPPGVNPTRSQEWATDISVFFPNMFIQLIAPGWYFVYTIWPLAVDRCLWEARIYSSPPADAAQRFAREYIMITVRDSILEDLSTCENVQANLKSGAIDSLPLHEGELFARHLLQVVEECIQEEERR